MIDLVPNGCKVRVANRNKLQYLDLLAQHRPTKSVREEVEYFLRGLNELIPDNLLSIFDDNELELLMCGTGNYSIADFKVHYVVCGSSTAFIKKMAVELSGKFDLDQFDPSPDPDFNCPICQGVLKEPVENPCRHVYCRGCIEKWLNSSFNCPTCRDPVYKEVIKSVLPFLLNMINRLTRKCKFQQFGCEERIQLERYDNHVNNCDFEMLTCRYKKATTRKPQLIPLTQNLKAMNCFLHLLLLKKQRRKLLIY